MSAPPTPNPCPIESGKATPFLKIEVFVAGGLKFGKPREINEYMPSDGSADLSNKVIVLYGDFKKACFLGDRRGITIQVLRELYAASGQISVLGTERFDFN